MVYMPCLNSRQPIAQRPGELLSMPVSDQDFSPKWLLASPAATSPISTRP
jgi:hypothetical protein